MKKMGGDVAIPILYFVLPVPAGFEIPRPSKCHKFKKAMISGEK